MTNNEMKKEYFDKLTSRFGSSDFSIKQAKELFEEFGFGDVKKSDGNFSAPWIYVHTHVLCKNKSPNGGRGQYRISGSVDAVKKEVKKSIKKDMDIINESVVTPTQEAQPAVMSMAKLKPSVVNLIPKKDPQYVSWGHFKDIKSIIESKVFYPIFVTGLSGNGKTSMIREVCAKLKRDMVRVNITVETDEDDLLGGFRLVNGETVWQDGPLVVAMKTGAVALIDEVDLASHKIMCLQPIMEGQPIYLKKINEIVHPAEGFNIVATANTKGKGSADGRFMGTNILNEAFLDRFSATFYQEYPSTSQEEKILKKQFAKYEISEDDFVSKLVKWADVIRRSFKEGAVDDIVTTRRLIDITKTFSIFNNKMKSISLCLERFDDETRDSFADLYTKVDAGASFEDISAEAGVTIEEETNEDDNVPF